jgi:hypothetical protein
VQDNLLRTGLDTGHFIDALAAANRVHALNAKVNTSLSLSLYIYIYISLSIYIYLSPSLSLSLSVFAFN